jgi:hypothetical protein
MNTMEDMERMNDFMDELNHEYDDMDDYEIGEQPYENTDVDFPYDYGEM